MDYKLTRKAKSDLKNIYRYTLENFGLTQAEDYLDGIYHSFDLLAENPLMSGAFDERRRRFPYRLHYIYYKPVSDRILILEIRHARQLPPSRLQLGWA